MGNLVRLKYATTQEFSLGGIPGGVAYTYVRVKVKNSHYEKEVRAHYKPHGPSGPWADIELPWIANYGDYDLFGLNQGFVTHEFVVRARVGDQTEWENRGGANYRLGTFQQITGEEVVLARAVAKQGLQGGGGFTIRTSWFEGEIYVSNLAFAKRVGVRFTANDWASWQDRDAVYWSPAGEGTYATSTGVEVWRFKTPELNYDAASDVFSFAVYFNRLDTGQWFWDSNFGRNYKLPKSHDLFIE